MYKGGAACHPETTSETTSTFSSMPTLRLPFQNTIEQLRPDHHTWNCSDDHRLAIFSDLYAGRAFQREYIWFSARWSVLAPLTQDMPVHIFIFQLNQPKEGLTGNILGVNSSPGTNSLSIPSEARHFLQIDKYSALQSQPSLRSADHFVVPHLAPSSGGSNPIMPS